MATTEYGLASDTAARPPGSWAEVPLHVWAQVVTLVLLFVYLHWNIISTMVDIAKRDPDWSHALLVPFFSLYFIHHHREKIFATQARTCWWGLLLFLFGLTAHLLAIFPVRSIMSQGYTTIIEIFGLILLLLGPRMLRILWFPAIYLVFAVKFSNRIWNLIAWKLQFLAAQSAAVLLNILGVEAEVKGSTIELWRGVDYLGALNVAEACSGLRMLVAFVALGVALVYLVERPLWTRLVLIALTVPIAVAVNVIRVTITGLLHLVNPELSAGDFHLFIGMIMVIPAVMLFLLVGWILDHIFIDVEHEDEENYADEG